MSIEMKKLEVSPDSIKVNGETPAPLTPEKKDKDHSSALENSNSKMLTPGPDALDGESDE